MFRFAGGVEGEEEAAGGDHRETPAGAEEGMEQHPLHPKRGWGRRGLMPELALGALCAAPMGSATQEMDFFFFPQNA